MGTKFIIEALHEKERVETKNPIFQHFFNKVDNKPKWVLIK